MDTGFLNAVRLNETDCRAVFALDSVQASVGFGKNLAMMLGGSLQRELGLEAVTIGLVAKPNAGKTTMARGIYEGLESRYPMSENMLSTLGVWDTQSLKGGLIRHFDLAVQPDDDDPSNFPEHWRTLEQGLAEPGVEIVEHAQKFKDNRYACVIRLGYSDPQGSARDGQTRIAQIYASDLVAGTRAFGDFLNICNGYGDNMDADSRIRVDSPAMGADMRVYPAPE